ncbi:MAG TPA: Ldh family oxidoreductase [Burkholderiales bacterium]|nr:Ldh family oxidoreductase [Burkholderiales bacterium]
MAESKTPAPIVVSAEALRRFVAGVFEAKGMPRAHAATVADVLVWANLRGTDSHGVSRVPRYLEMIEAGDLNPAAEPQIRTESAASVLIDADRAAGPVAMTFAMAAATDKAKQVGIGLALARATTHTAALGYYTLKAAGEGVAAIAASASIPNMAYHGARAAGVSTSPISIAVPGGERGPVVLDLGSGIVSIGGLALARRQGKPIPEGWALDEAGIPTTDPQRAEIPLPMAGPKGSGLALMVECLASLMVANPILADTVGRPARGRRHRQNAFAIAIDVARFGDPALFAREVDRLAATLKALPRNPDVPEILMPGERGARSYEKRSRDGIPLPRRVADELARVAERLGIAIFPVN